ncbi:MAG: TonB family protein [Deferribacterales bacterium]
MRNKFVWFILISVLLHLLILSLLDIQPEKKEEKKPITVSVIPKERPEPTPAPEPQPAPKPEAQPQRPPEPMRDIPLNEDLDTDLDQMAPVPEHAAPEQKQAKGEEPAPEPKSAPDKSDLQEVPNDNAPVELPEITPWEDRLADKQLDGILNPDEIINKYASGGGTPKGEDHVSMQYVKVKYQSYFYKFSRRLYQVWIYPRAAAVRGEQGTVRISFQIARDGMISGINIIRSSGYPDLDREAVEALRKTAGVPLPDSYELNFLRVDAYFQYILNKGFVVY